MKYWIQTFGCQMNVYDTDSMAGLLNEAGHEWTSNEEEAEMILLNTCAIRENAEERVRGRLGQLKRHKDAGTLKYLGVCGCMGQKEGERLTRSIPHLDLVMGPGAIGSVARIVDNLRGGGGPVVDLTGIEDEYDQPNPAAAGGIAYPRFVSVMKGCNKKCTFCVVPNTRGPERSRDPRIILQEVETLARMGYREVTLIGQTVNSYRKDGVRFPQLLEMVNAAEGIERIRFTTSYPATSAGDLFGAMARLDKVCEHLHLPVQSGSNRVLKRMRRIYTRETYLEQIAAFREALRNRPVPAALSTDIIVGFPGETREDFEETLDLVREARFDSAFMFKYSPRRDTPAAGMEDPVPEFVKAGRLDKLIKLQNQIAREINQTMTGTSAEAMVERRYMDTKIGPCIEARLRNGKIVKIADCMPEAKPGDLFDVEITGCSSYTLFGRPTGTALPRPAAQGA